MAQIGPTEFAPIAIGDVAKPPFVRLPDPATMFAHRATRLTTLAEGHELRPYLLFLAGLCGAQHRIATVLADPQLPNAEALARARQFRVPPLDRLLLARGPAMDAVWQPLLALIGKIAMPDNARRALERVSATDADSRAAIVDAALQNAPSAERLAEHVYVFAALQLHFARLAARLDDKVLVPVGDGACPACGGPPVATMVVGWSGAQNTRFCACSLCGTLWNYPRIKCALCGANDSIAYQEIADKSAGVKAETCGTCHRYVKTLQQHANSALDPVADDVATLALDLLLRQSEYRRGSVNPFLLGY